MEVERGSGAGKGDVVRECTLLYGPDVREGLHLVLRI
jgi:hypothetical protein